LRLQSIQEVSGRLLDPSIGTHRATNHQTADQIVAQLFVDLPETAILPFVLELQQRLGIALNFAEQPVPRQAEERCPPQPDIPYVLRLTGQFEEIAEDRITSVRFQCGNGFELRP
jgi:hypothetical protein